MDCWTSCEKPHTFTWKLISQLITIVISAPLFYKSHFIYKYPLSLLALYTGISTPPIFQGTSILRKHNSHTLPVIQEKQCCYATPRWSKTSQSQIPTSAETEMAIYQLRNKFTQNSKQIIKSFMHKAPPQQEELFCTYKCACAGI